MKRHALFVGVNTYEDEQIRDLDFSLSDAHALKTLFELFGFESDILENPSKSDVFHAVRQMTADLVAGDLFFFYFAGHGWTTTSGKHLLFCSDDMYEDLRDDDAGISFDKLKRKTTGDYNRAFVLDACRSDFITGTRGGDTTTRDLRPIGELVKDAPAKSSLAVLRSCSQYEHALEIRPRKHGLFTLAMMEVLRTSKECGRELLFGEALCDAVMDKMLCIAKDEGITAEQTPEFAKSGLAQVLIEGSRTDVPPMALPSHVVPSVSSSCVLSSNDGAVPLRAGNVGRVPVAIKGRLTLFKAIAASAAVVIVALAAWIWADYPDADDPLLYPPQERYVRGESFLKRWWFREGNEKNALKWIEDAAKEGLSDAQFEMGEIMEDGKFGMGKNEIEAQKWYELAAKQNHIGALCKMGLFLFEGRGGSRIDYKKAFSYLYSAATNGLSMAQKAVGDCYRTGECVGETNMTEAVRFYNLAAAQGDADALFELYRIFRCGTDNIASNEHAAVTYLKRAEEAGSSLAMIDLGTLYGNGKMGFRKNQEKAFHLFLKAANAGNAVGQFNLGVSYGGGLGVGRDDSEAVKWYRKAAEQGHVHAQANLGRRYYHGVGVHKDPQEAIKWFRAAASGGCGEAWVDLGDCYYFGVGIKQDYAEAAKCYRAAAVQGNVEAQYNLGECYQNGHGVERNYVDAVKWYRNAAEGGFAVAELELGNCYSRGHGVDKSYEEALRWWLKAAGQGDARAQFNIGVYYENGYGVEKSFEEAAKWYRKAAERGYEDAKKALERLR